MNVFTLKNKWLTAVLLVGILSWTGLPHELAAQPEYRKRKKREKKEETPPPPPVITRPVPVPKPAETTPTLPPPPAVYYISGKVIDFESRQPREGVVINVVGKGVSARTDRNGNFKVAVTGNNNVQLSAALPKYKSKTINAVPGDDDLIIALKKESTLSPVVEGKEIETAPTPVVSSDIDFSSLLDVKTSTASKSAEKISDAPGIISTITREEIERLGGVTLADVLQRASSLFVTSTSLFTQNAISIRGDLSTHINNHVLILVDGRPFREGIFGGLDMSILASFPLKEIAQIEVIRGPGSVLYGTNAYAGVINIITRSGGEETSIRGTVGGGNLGAMTASFSGGGTVGDSLQVHGGVQFYKDDGWDFTAFDERGAASPDRPNGDPIQKTIQNNRANFGARFGAKYRNFTFNTLYTFTEYRAMGSTPNWLTYTNGDPIKNERFFADAGYSKELSRRVRLDVNATMNGHNTGFRLGPTAAALNPFREYSLDFLLEPTLHLNYLRKRLNVVFGGVLWNLNGQARTGNAITIPDYSDVWSSAYTQVSYQPTKLFKLIAGAQANSVPGQGTNIVPRGGLIFNPLPGLGVKVLYGEAFRAAFRGETSINAVRVISGNPNLKAEIIGTLDAQIFYDLKKVQLSATYFNSRQRDLITRRPVLDPLVGASYFNADRLTTNGVELELKATPLRSLLITGSLLWQENTLAIEDTVSGVSQRIDIRDFTTMPNLFYKLSVIYNFKRYASIGGFYQFTDQAAITANYDPIRNRFFGNEERNRINPVAAAYHLVTLNLSLHLLPIFKVTSEKDLNLQIYVFNLLNQQGNMPEFNRRNINTIPMLQSRSFVASLTYRF